jgi:hypothetical protein
VRGENTLILLPGVILNVQHVLEKVLYRWEHLKENSQAKIFSNPSTDRIKHV